MFCLNTKAFVLILSILTYCQAEDDYCRNDLCPKRTTHIACTNRWTFGSKCSTNVMVMPLDQSDKDALVKEHNLVRKKWASGKGKVPRPACKMATMEWDQDLANIAEINVRSCSTQHDYCRNTEKYPQSGQNLFKLSTTKKVKQQSPTKLIQQALVTWTKKESKITSEDLETLAFKSLHIVGHLTLLINEKNTKVGCAMVTYTKKFRYYHLACNYAITNSVDKSVYTKCSEPGSGCSRQKVSEQYPPLCA